MRMHLDFEVFSEVNLKQSPLDVYAAHPSTKIILAAFAFDNEPIEVWEADKGRAPKRFVDGLRDPAVTLVAWNTTYERTILKYKKLDIPLSRWIDPMVHARYVGLPGKLKLNAEIEMLGVPKEDRTKNETLLIKKFCMPNKEGKRILGEGKCLVDWATFVDYCRKDVATERHVLHWIEAGFPFPAIERRLWELDQTINGRGLPVDTDMAAHAAQEYRRLMATSLEKQNAITGLLNSNSIVQLLPWLQERGYQFDSLGKDFLENALEVCPLTTDARSVVSLRLASAKSSVKKFQVMVDRASPDEVLCA